MKFAAKKVFDNNFQYKRDDTVDFSFFAKVLIYFMQKMTQYGIWTRWTLQQEYNFTN